MSKYLKVWLPSGSVTNYPPGVNEIDRPDELPEDYTYYETDDEWFYLTREKALEMLRALTEVMQRSLPNG